LPEAKVSEIRSVKGAKVFGTRAGNWLTRAQAEKLLSLPDIETLKGKRARALLALFLSAGLRREELATLLRDQMQQRDGRWCLVDLIEKGGRVRTVAIPDWTQQAVAVWLEAMPIKEGPVLGKVNKGGRFVGAGHVRPFHLRRGCGVCRAARRRIPAARPETDVRKTRPQGRTKIEQIQLSDGHASLTTTERYLGIEQDLEDAPCDH
jgi:integrase